MFDTRLYDAIDCLMKTVRYVTQEEAGDQWPELVEALKTGNTVMLDNQAWTIESIAQADGENYLVAECREVAEAE